VAGEIAYVGLGANLDEPQAQVLRALDELAALPQTTLLARSALYRSAPVDATGPDYVNAVARLRTQLGAAGLLRALQAIEQRHGRLRTGFNAPRTLDLDLLLYGSERHDDVQLRVPHPRLHLRAFVLRPLLELDPALALPGLGPLSACLAAVQGQALQRIDDQGEPR
jgi:2-amino-4-hydroxy-6-hydroxymethyldihydropteridine diphosphokinase